MLPRERSIPLAVPRFDGGRRWTPGPPEPRPSLLEQAAGVDTHGRGIRTQHHEF
jgi:hypothetical protein